MTEPNAAPAPQPLLNCPFCGSEAILRESYMYHVVCTGQGCRGAYKPSLLHSNANAAITRWNDQPRIEQLERDRARLQQQLASVLDVAIARGVQLGYDDDDYRAMYHAATGNEWSDDE